MRSGARWSDMSEDRYGKYKSVHKRFTRWAKKGIWEKIFKHLIKDRDNEYLMIDSTIVKAHQQAATFKDQALGRSRGGLTTKIHMMCDALGLPVKFILTTGESSDFGQAIPLLENEEPNYVLADRGYDSDEIIDYIKQIHAIPVIPPRSNRIIKRDYDHIIYRERNLIERLFNRLKQFRKIATRFEKIQINFEALIYLASSYLWLI